jgi:NDP-sugar pyrophosphorylase family protein
MDLLLNFGAKNVLLCTGYRGELIEKSFGNCYKDLTLSYSRENVPLGTGGALRLGLKDLHSEYVLVINGDSYIKESLAYFLEAFSSREETAGMLVVKVQDTSPYGAVEFSNEGRLLKFTEKGRRGAGYINAGIYLIHQELLSQIEEQREVSLEYELLPLWQKSGVCCIPSDAPFIDIGTPESLKRAEVFFNSAWK